MHASSTKRNPRAIAFVFVAAIAAACGVHTSQNGAVQITAVNPGTGSITGGLAVTIEGQGLDDGSGNATVLFGTSPATVNSVSSGSIQVTLPAGLACGHADVQVSNAHGSAFKASAFTYTGGNNSITVTSVSPAQGDLAGGTPVTITGTGFTGGVGVSLGGVPLQNITIVSDTQITAVTPSAANGGEVDLVMRNCASQASLTKAFIYTTGLNGGLVDMNLTDYLNPAQFATPTPQDYIDPYVAFIEPSTESLVNALPAAGTCAFNPTPAPAANVTVVDAGATVQLASGATTITLAKQTNGDYYFPYDSNGNLTSSHYQPGLFAKNAVYDIDATGGQIPAFSVTGAFDTPADYTISAPNISATTPTTVPRSSLAFTWSGGSAGDHFEIELIGYDNAGAATNQILFCLAAADGATGSYTISNADMGKFTAATTQLIVLTNRRKDTPFIIPANGSTGIALASLYKVGYLFLP